MTQITINNGDTGLTVRNALNFMFTELYGLPSLGISTGQITNWDEAYSWGNHADAGYLTVETDPVFTEWLNNIPDLSEFNNDVGYLTVETDPVFQSSAAAGISSSDIVSWNAAAGLAGNSWQKGGNTLTASSYVGSLNAYPVRVGANNLNHLELQTTNAMKYLAGQYWYPSSDSTTAFQLRRANGSTIDFNYDSTNGRIGIGTTEPDAKLHVDFGNATAGSMQLTNGTTTGQTSADGFHVGLDTNGNAIINQKENLYLALYTNNTERLRYLAGGGTSERTGTYKYLDTSPTADTVNDIRISNQSGTFTVEKCTVANATKGAGTWVTVLTA